jgi:hypothetical protein
MLTRLLAAVAALCLFTSPALADSVATAQASTVIVLAHVHVHYLTAQEIQARMSDTPNSHLIHYKHGHEAPPKDEDYDNQEICSGVVVQSVPSSNWPYVGTMNEILTARHCKGTETEYLFSIPFVDVTITPTGIKYFDGDTGSVQGAYPSKTYDLQLLQSDAEHNHAPVAIQASPVLTGEPLFVFGMPGGIEWAYSSAHSLTGTDETTIKSDGKDFAGLLRLDCASCFGGDSGAGVWDSDGTIVGILVAGSESQPALALIVPSYKISKFLTDGQ